MMFKHMKMALPASLMQVAGSMLLFANLTAACGGEVESYEGDEFIEEGYEDDKGFFTPIADEFSGQFSGERVGEKVPFETIEQALNWSANGRIVEPGRMFIIRMKLPALVRNIRVLCQTKWAMLRIFGV